MNELKALIDVKTITTFIILSVFSYLAISGKITPDNVVQVTFVIITFFFAKKSSETGVTK